MNTTPNTPPMPDTTTPPLTSAESNPEYNRLISEFGEYLQSRDETIRFQNMLAAFHEAAQAQTLHEILQPPHGHPRVVQPPMPLPPHDPTPPSARRVPPEPSPPPRIVLDLSLGDAIVLATVCDHVAGHKDGPRGSVDHIRDALWAANVRRDDALSGSGTITFSKDWPTD